MPLPQKPFRDWDADDLVQLCKEPKVEEGDRLDFKADCELLSADKGKKESAADKDKKEKAKRDILRDISAMANSLGGALLIGVRQSDKRGDRPFAEKIVGVENVVRLQQTIEDLANVHLDIRPGTLAFKTIKLRGKDDRSVLIIRIPQNTYSLSMVTYDYKGKGRNQFWARRGWNNTLMTTTEIQYQFGQMTKIKESAADELRKIESRLAEDHADRSLIWFAAVPISRSRDHIPVEIGRIEKIINDSCYYREFEGGTLPDNFQQGSPSCSIGYYGLVPSLYGVQLRNKDKNHILQIHRDGTIVFGRNVDFPPDATEVGFWLVYEIWYSALCLLKDIQEHFSVSSIAIAKAGLCGFESKFLNTFQGSCPTRLAIQDRQVPLDTKMLDETWTPSGTFRQWALQLANYGEIEELIVCPPWIPYTSK